MTAVAQSSAAAHTLAVDLAPEPAAGPRFSIVVAGDVCPQGPLERPLATGDAKGFWGDVGEAVRQHAVAICNLECPLTRTVAPLPKVGPHLRADPLCADGVRAAGFGVASLANNHILDMGPKGLLETLSACERAGMRTLGAGATLDHARRPLLLTCGESSIAIVGACENEFSIATPRRAGAAPLDPIDSFEQVREARAEADIVLVLVHGGNESYPLPSPRLVKTCRFLAAAGASAVICHHSHVASGFEIVRDAPIVYGTGNLAFWDDSPSSGWNHGYLVSLSVAGGRLSRLELIPYTQCAGHPHTRRLRGREAELFLESIAEHSRTIADPELLSRSWAAFCGSQRAWYLAQLAALGKADQLLWQRGLLPEGVLRRRSLDWLGLLRCQSHLDVVLASLESLAEHRPIGSDGG